MSMRDELETLKGKALRRIGEAAKAGDTRIIINATRVVQEVERLMKTFDELMNEIGRLTMDYEGLEDSCDVDISTSSDAQISPRKRGRLRKEAFINDLKEHGVALNMSKDSLLLTQEGALVGVAYSTEHLPGRWWLGMKNDNYKAVVLICERDSGGIVRIIIPGDFWADHVEHLNENKQGRSMIHVLYQRGMYHWIETNEKIPIDRFVDAYNFLR